MEMDQEKENQAQDLPETTPEETPGYIPRPKWQIIGAWIALILFVFVLAYFYFDLARGGF